MTWGFRGQDLYSGARDSSEMPRPKEPEEKGNKRKEEFAVVSMMWT